MIRHNLKEIKHQQMGSQRKDAALKKSALRICCHEHVLKWMTKNFGYSALVPGVKECK